MQLNKLHAVGRLPQGLHDFRYVTLATDVATTNSIEIRAEPPQSVPIVLVGVIRRDHVSLVGTGGDGTVYTFDGMFLKRAPGLSIAGTMTIARNEQRARSLHVLWRAEIKTVRM